MPYRFKIGESVAGAVRRIASEEINCAISHLSGSDPANRETDIHEARKAIKRVRALLRLVRTGLGGWFRSENGALRDIGRSLSDLRDSSVVLQTFDSLFSDPSDRSRLQEVRDGLVQQNRAKEKIMNPEKTLCNAAAALARVGERVSRWKLDSDGFEAIAKGLKAEYRGGRNAMSKALRSNDALMFHEWRKRVKCQFFHMRLLKNMIPGSIGNLEERLHELETALGDDHNLLVLRQHLRAHPSAFGGKAAVRQSIRLVSAREAKLRAEAEALGHVIYTGKPKAFVGFIRERWAIHPRRTIPKARAPAA